MSDYERAQHFMYECFKAQEETKTLRDKVAGLERENATLKENVRRLSDENEKRRF